MICGLLTDNRKLSELPGCVFTLPVRSETVLCGIRFGLSFLKAMGSGF